MALKYATTGSLLGVFFHRTDNRQCGVIVRSNTGAFEKPEIASSRRSSQWHKGAFSYNHCERFEESRGNLRSCGGTFSTAPTGYCNSLSELKGTTCHASLLPARRKPNCSIVTSLVLAQSKVENRRACSKPPCIGGRFAMCPYRKYQQSKTCEYGHCQQFRFFPSPVVKP